MRALAAFAPEEQPDSETLLIASVVGELVDCEYSGDELAVEQLRLAQEEPAEVSS